MLATAKPYIRIFITGNYFKDVLNITKIIQICALTKKKVSTYFLQNLMTLLDETLHDKLATSVYEQVVFSHTDAN